MKQVGRGEVGCAEKGGINKWVRFLGLFTFAGLDILFLEGDGTRCIMNLLVQPAGVADNVPVAATPPQRGGGGGAVGTGRALPLAAGHAGVLGLDQRPVGAVHLVVETAGVAEVVARRVPPPQGRGRHAAVHALPCLLVMNGGWEIEGRRMNRRGLEGGRWMRQGLVNRAGPRR